MRRWLRTLVVLCLISVAVFLTGQAPTETWAQERCRVVTVLDGDTVRLADGRTVRLAGIDAPEKKPEQFGALRAQQRLAALLKTAGWQVFLEPVGRDRYGRWVADVRLPDGRSLCETLLREGLAVYYWHEDVPEEFCRRLLAAQRDALRNRAGNWRTVLTLPVAKESFVGNQRSRRFFSRGCRGAAEISVHNRQQLTSLEQALEQGFSPARHCGIWPLQREVSPAQ